MKDKIFISYNRKDKNYLEEFHAFLAPIIRNNSIDVWDDTRILPGQNWHEEIKNALADAKVAVLFISPDYLASNYIAEHELPPLLKAAEEEGLKLLWILLKPCLWERTTISKYQSLFDPSKPIAMLSMSARKKVWSELCEKIIKIKNIPLIEDSKKIISRFINNDKDRLLSRSDDNYSEIKFDVFLSYNSNDRSAVINLAKRLIAYGIKVWLDVWELRPGEAWQQAFENYINCIGAVAVLVGSDGIGSWQSHETRAYLSEFIERKMPVIPVLLKNCPAVPKLPLFLKHFSWVDLRDPINDEGFYRLVWGITGKKPIELSDSSDQNIFDEYLVSRNAQDEPSQSLSELKLLLVGRGRAGKTTLIKQLVGEIPDEYEAETHSIAIRRMWLDCPHGRVQTYAWDFGGQEILHATHQFFLTERSLYLLVLEPRSGLASRDAEYWLSLIKNQGGNSPTIIIMNWSHERQWLVDVVKLSRKFPFIIDFVSTDAIYGDGIDELKRIMVSVVQEKMSDVWQPFPKRWKEIKNAVAGMSENYLTYSQYTALCSRWGEDDPVAQSALAGYLHDLGLALYYGKDPRLYDTRVLNPSWVTGGVYAVIRSSLVIKNDGQLSVEDMPQVLEQAEKLKIIVASEYPKDTHQFILELMCAFQLCYASEEKKGKPTRYLVPELLSEFEPKMEVNWEEAPVRLRYRYEVLPPGLLPRFIVRTHELSDGSPHWRNGVVLRHVDATALIRIESDRPELHVFVHGVDEETRRLLVTMVRRELEALNRDMQVSSIEELELSGITASMGIGWIGVRALRELEQPDMPVQKVPIQPEGTADVYIANELDKILQTDARAIDRGILPTPTPVRVFVSFAHDDESRLKTLDCILDFLELQHGLACWRDKRLIAGELWDQEIRKRLEEMDIFLFVASHTSLVRPYIRDPELRRAKERFDAGEIEVVTVKLEACACDEDPFIGKLQRLAPRFRSIVQAKEKSTAWDEVRKDLLPVIQRVRVRKETSKAA